MILAFEAIDAAGTRASDTLEASSIEDAIERLRSRGLYVTNISESSPKNVTKGNWGSLTRAPRLPLKTVMLFTRQMAMLLQAGSAVVPAVVAIRRQLKDGKQAAILDQLASDLEDGTSFTEALQKHPLTFDSVYCAIVAAGEASGTLTQMFERLAEIVGKRRAMRNKVIGALAYPALLICMSSSILSSLVLFVLPRFSDMFKQLGVEPPATTKMMLQGSAFAIQHWLIILVVVVVLLVTLVGLALSNVGRQWYCNVQLKIPILGRVRGGLIQSLMFRTMGTLLSCGVGVLETLQLVRRSTNNERFQALFDDLDNSVTAGGNLSDAFERSGLVDPATCQAIRTGEDSGNLGGAINFCADILDETTSEVVDISMRLIEPLILIVMGFVVGGVAISLFMPLFDMTAAI